MATVCNPSHTLNVRTAFMAGGWTIEKLQELFKPTLGEGWNLRRILSIRRSRAPVRANEPGEKPQAGPLRFSVPTPLDTDDVSRLGTPWSTD